MKSLKLSPVAIGMAMRTLREQVKMSANDLAKQTGMTPSSLSRTENGYRSLELAEADLIAVTIGTTVADLLRVARHLEDSGTVQQREKALVEFHRSLAEVKGAATVALADLQREMESSR
jgi:transcriptional regulator with XRE-family HTH domain